MKAVPYADCAPGMMRCAQVLLAWRWWLAAMAARGLQQRDHTALTAAISLSVYRPRIVWSGNRHHDFAPHPDHLSPEQLCALAVQLMQRVETLDQQMETPETLGSAVALPQ